jgi:putative chitinase
MQVTKEQLQSVFGMHIAYDLTEALNAAMESYGIDSVMEVAAFLAQVGHESGSFKFFKENLNYSAEGLLKIFPKYFNAATAATYARNPEKIANRVYANRMGNGDEASGDGWKYKGLGCIQITGKQNHTAYAFHKEIPIEKSLKYLETIEGACDSAGWFWWNNKLDDVCHDVVKLTKKINGGTHGLEDRTAKFKKLYAILDQK